MSDMFHSELVTYHKVSPDPQIAGCQNTGEHVDGVVFLGIEPLNGFDMFIGRPSLIEAMAVMYGLKPDEVVERLTGAEPEPAPKRSAKKAPREVKVEDVI